MVPFWPPKNPETWVKWVENWVKIMENIWKMGIKSEQKLGKLLNKHGFPISWECVRVLWRSWPHTIKLNEWMKISDCNCKPLPNDMQAMLWVPTHLTMSEFTVLFWPHPRGGTWVWLWRGCEARALNPIPIFRGESGTHG